MDSNEQVLREYINHAIKLVLEKRQTVINEENKLRGIVRTLISEETSIVRNNEQRIRQIVRQLILTEAGTPSIDDDQRQRRSTGINALADIMSKLVADLQVGYKSLTTSTEQRASFRDHILAAVEDTLSTVMPYGIPDADGDEASAALAGDAEIAGDPDLAAALAEAAEFKVKIDPELLGDDPTPPEEPPEEKPDIDQFPDVEGAERTGRNFAAETFKRVEPTIVKSYKNLADVADRQDFYEYLVDNIGKYFERFETEMTPDLDSEEYVQNMDAIQQTPPEEPPAA